MKSEIEKCTIFIMNKGKQRNRTTQSGNHQNTCRKRMLQISLGILEMDTIKQMEVKRKERITLVRLE